jgi:UDP-N-acetylglucosamine--N-acetylmuramyl-(pentapeptide) pyrophosphoryl-undecaprenol N-acetylglucosamine transferase
VVPTSSNTFIFAGGGSGGHISPGLAIAERLKEISPESHAIFVCSQRAIDASMLSEAGAEFVPVPASPPSFKPTDAIKFWSNFAQSKGMVKRLIRRRNVNAVVTLGGFVAAPAVSAAKSCGVPVVLVNLDAPPGRANQWMANRSDMVVSAIDLPTMPDFASQVVGMPIRRRAIASLSAAECRSRLGTPPNLPHLFVTGASQGATSVNAFMMAMAQAHPDIFRGWHVYHLTGSGAETDVHNAYAAAGISATVQPFLNDIGLAWGAADLAISRAGASSVAEAAANFAPTLFLPYPYHKDMHQKHNAQPLVDLGGAAMALDEVDPKENVQSIGPVLRDLILTAPRRQAMRQILREHQPGDAALTIARMLVDLHALV